MLRRGSTAMLIPPPKVVSTWIMIARLNHIYNVLENLTASRLFVKSWRVHPRVGGNYPRQISKIEAYGAEIFSAHEGSWEKGTPAIF